MELRQYWKFVLRRWPLMVIPAVVVLGVGLITYESAAPVYNAGVRFISGQVPGEATDISDEQRYYSWLTSEYIVNGLTDWVRGGTFATAVSQKLAEQGVNVPAGTFPVAADNTRSMLTLSITYPDPEVLGVIMEAAMVVLTEENAGALPQLGGETAVLVQLDMPVVTPIAPSLRSRLELPLRVVMAVVVGVGLALLVEYLDPTIRDRDELAVLELTILGEIPKK